MGDKPIKSVVKAISWRITASIITFILVFVFTGEVTLALGVGILDTLIKIFAFYIHERGWNRMKWGRDKKL